MGIRTDAGQQRGLGCGRNLRELDPWPYRTASR